MTTKLADIVAYFAAQQENRERLFQLPVFQRLAPLIDTAYRQATTLVPKDRTGAVLGRLLLVCHSSFLSALSLLAQAQPHDAAPVTRRAIEAVRLAAAIKSNPKMLEMWIAYEQRQARWNARQEGKRPTRLNIQLPITHQLVSELMDTWGIVSDAAVHFTPEYLADLSWSMKKVPEGYAVWLNYFVEDISAIVRDVIIMTGSHAKMLEVFDWCWEGTLGKSDEWVRTMKEAYAVGNEINESRGK